LRDARSKGLIPERALREIFQKTVLYSLSIRGLWLKYVFQGGTSLRLFYDSPRYSLDLDFTYIGGQKNVIPREIEIVRNTVERIFSPYSILVDISREKLISEERFYRCFLVFDTSRIIGRKLRIKIEVLCRSYSQEMFLKKILLINFPIQTSIGVLGKTPNQLLVDKVASLAGGYHRGFIRWRDIFDIYWLRRRFNALVEPDYLALEYGSYIEKPEDLDKLQHLLEKILSNGKYKDIISELAKILPLGLASKEFVKQYIETSLLVIKEAKEVLNA